MLLAQLDMFHQQCFILFLCLREAPCLVPFCRAGTHGQVVLDAERVAHPLFVAVQVVEVDPAIRYDLCRVQEFLTKHRLHLLPLFDMIYMFDGGEIVGAGTVDELLQSCPKFVELWQKQRLEVV